MTGYQLRSAGTPSIFQDGIADMKLSQVLPNFTLRLATKQSVDLHRASPDDTTISTPCCHCCNLHSTTHFPRGKTRTIWSQGFFLHLLQISGRGLSQTRHPSCYPANSVKAVKKSKSIEPNQRKLSTGLILSSSSSEVVLLLLCWLSNTSTITVQMTIKPSYK